MKTLSCSLPVPSETLLIHSKKLLDIIYDEIANSNGYGYITFARFMEIVLYAPGLGYYSAGLNKIGKSGDFITAPEISNLFARCLAKQCQQVLEIFKDNGNILEFGAGTGSMAGELLLELEKNYCLPQQYFILEVSAELKQRQQALLNRKVPHLISRIQWLDHLPDQPFTGVILANEVLDAMPVHIFDIKKNNIRERFIAREKEKLVWHVDEVSSSRLMKQIHQINIQSDHYISEFNLQLPYWIKSLSNLLNKGLILLIDYGFPQHEYYHPDRCTGTLMSHYHHRAHTDPLILIGLQDITAHVNFTYIAENAAQYGLNVDGFTTQAAFLLSTGLLDFVKQSFENIQDRVKINYQVNTLTSPNEMGEIYKVMALTRAIDNLMPLVGFKLQDQRQRL